jgi:type IV pilus assembly protein PilC
MQFEYRALLNGKTLTGHLDAETQKEVTDYLKSNGYLPLEIKEKQEATINSVLGMLDKISFNDVVYMTRQFSIMLNAGLTLIDSLEILKKQTTKRVMKRMLEDIDKSLREGKNFSQALSKYPHLFSHFFIALVRSGEASGKLDIILSKLAENLEKQREFRQKIKNALIYPIVIISAMITMMFLMMTFVVPKLLELYDSFEVELSTSTQALITVSTFFEDNYVWIILGVGLSVFLIKRFLKTPAGKRMFDTNALYLPVFGKIIQTAALVDTTRTLSILIGSGVPILDSLNIVTDVNENTLFQEAFKRITQKVEKGISLGTAMSNERIFPESLVQMTIVGEQTGHIDETLAKVADYYQSESELAVKGMLTLLEPTIIVVLGVAVGFLVLTVITPIFSLTNSLQ